jgi:hypothetical protein
MYCPKDIGDDRKMSSMLNNIHKMLKDLGIYIYIYIYIYIFKSWVDVVTTSRTMGVLGNVKKTSRDIAKKFQTMGGHWGRMEALEKGRGNTKQWFLTSLKFHDMCKLCTR